MSKEAIYVLACGLAAFILTQIWRVRRLTQRQQSAKAYEALIADDPNPTFIMDETAHIVARNSKAVEGGFTADKLTDDLRVQIADGDVILRRLLEGACFDHKVADDLTSKTARMRIEISQIDDHFLVCSLKHRTRPVSRNGEGPELPMVTAASNGTVLFMNPEARDFLGTRCTSLTGIFADVPTMSDLNMVLTESGSKPCFVMENELTCGRKEIFLIPALGKKRLGADISYEDMPVAVLKIGASGEILAANRMARHLIGPHANISGHFSDIMEGLGRPLADWLTEAAQGRAYNLSEFLRIKRDDREVFVQVTLGRAFDEGATQLYAVIHDATELKTLEAQFVQSQKMQAIGQLAGGIAHDFNNLLTAISGHCDLLLVDRPHDDSAYADLIQVRQNAQRAAALVGQLLAFSRKQTLQPSIVDFTDLLNDVSHLLNRLVSDDVNLLVEHGDDLGCAYLDPQQLEQVIVNLVVNARDAMPDGGDVILRTENLTLREPLCRERASVPPGSYVQIQVQDQGTGIAPSECRLVFEPFFTTKRTGEGTGLGLSTAYGIVKQSGGFIFLDSEVGKGSTFTLLFPVAEQRAPVFKHLDKPEAENRASIGGTVLLVEDETPVREFASRALQLKGFDVVEASCGEEALEILKDPALTVDLFLTDVAMPGIDGPTWVREALRNRADTGVIFISGYAQEKFASESERVEDAVFLPKPFSLEELTATVHQKLSQHSKQTVI